jgi:hypothetical protein
MSCGSGRALGRKAPYLSAFLFRPSACEHVLLEEAHRDRPEDL